MDSPRDRLRAARSLAAGINYFDLDFRGHSRIIASAIVHGSGSLAVVDPGPSSTLPVFRAQLEALGFSVGDITALLLTHVHLDHAGASGTLLRENPDIQVYVHERGAPHVIDPSKLVASATRLWGDETQALWGEVLPVPATAVEVLAGGEQLHLGGRILDVAYTPGHASHHVSYFNEETGIAFVGDTAGVMIQANGAVLLPTPPPDIDLPLWRESLTTIAHWNPETLFITHYGPASPALLHLQEVREAMEQSERLYLRSIEQGSDDAGHEAWFVDEVRRVLHRQMPDAAAKSYEVAGRFDLSWKGLDRAHKKART
jgi:glyoxylase-like metal-dependent hydrolase (beta-lactamase superfamily II)